MMPGKHRNSPETGAPMIQVHRLESGVLEQWYTFRNRDEVSRFIEEHPFLVSLLSEAHNKITTHFPHSRVFAEVMSEPDETDGSELVVSVATNLAPAEALDRLGQFDKDWWLDALEQAQGKLCINMEFV